MKEIEELKKRVQSLGKIAEHMYKKQIKLEGYIIALTWVIALMAFYIYYIY